MCFAIVQALWKVNDFSDVCVHILYFLYTLSENGLCLLVKVVPNTCI